MALRDTPDSCESDTVRIYRGLSPYIDEHPRAEVGVFHRQGIDALGVRIIDPDFEGVPWKARNENIWNVLDVAPAELVDRIGILLLMTPEEAAEIHLSSAEFDGPSDGPIPFLRDTQVFRENVLGETVFVTVGRPHLADGSRADRFDASFKFGFPPGILAADDYGLSIDAGELVRDANGVPRWFDSVESAKAAAAGTAAARLSRLAAA